MPKAAPVYSTEKSAQLGEILKKMASNPKGLLLRDLVQENKSKIQSALEAGYSYEDIITAFQNLEINIRPTTLKQYLRDPNASKPGSKGKKAKPKSLAPSVSTGDTPESDVGRDIASNPVDSSAAAADADSQPPQSSPPPPNTDRRGFQRMRPLDEL